MDNKEQNNNITISTLTVIIDSLIEPGKVPFTTSTSLRQSKLGIGQYKMQDSRVTHLFLMTLMSPMPTSSTKLSTVSGGAALVLVLEDDDAASVAGALALMWYFKISVQRRPRINFSLRLKMSDND